MTVTASCAECGWSQGGYPDRAAAEQGFAAHPCRKLGTCANCVEPRLPPAVGSDRGMGAVGIDHDPPAPPLITPLWNTCPACDELVEDVEEVGDEFECPHCGMPMCVVAWPDGTKTLEGVMRTEQAP